VKTLFALTFIAASRTMLHAAFIPSPSVGPINDASAIPFLTDTNGAASVRYQQVYGASDFAGQGSPAYLITEISFAAVVAPDRTAGPNVQIFLSTTSSSVDSLSPVFANNLGPNNTLVYSGPIDWTAGSRYGHGTFAFGIPLQQPFLYTWSAGNLLMDVRNYQTVPPPPEGYPHPLFEARNTLGDTVSLAAAFDVNSPTASLFVNTVGLSTLFTVTGVPEPSSAFLLLAGLSVLAFLGWRPRGHVRANRDVVETR